MILVIPVLVSINKLIEDNKSAKIASIIASIVIFMLMTIIITIILTANGDLETIEMPAVYAISNMSQEFNILYGIIILLSIFTTAISLGISFLKNTTKTEKQYFYYNLFMLISGMIFSNIGFSNLINIFFPVLGIIGIFQILKVIVM